MKEKLFVLLTSFLLLSVFTMKAQTSDNLEGEDFVNNILDKGGLVRITNRRTSTANLTDNGTKTLGVRANVNNL